MIATVILPMSRWLCQDGSDTGKHQRDRGCNPTQWTFTDQSIIDISKLSWGRTTRTHICIISKLTRHSVLAPSSRPTSHLLLFLFIASWLAPQTQRYVVNTQSRGPERIKSSIMTCYFVWFRSPTECSSLCSMNAVAEQVTVGSILAPGSLASRC